MVGVIALDAAEVLAEEKRRAGDEDDSGESEDREHTVPDCTFLFEEDPRQQGGEHWIAVGFTRNGDRLQSNNLRAICEG